MVANNQDFRSPIKRAKGLGSAHAGVHHWMMQRVTAIALIPLTVWFIYSVLELRSASYADFTAWISSPINAVVMILFIIASFYHAVLGAQVIVEDYIQCKCLKMIKLIGQKLFFIALAIATIFSILKIAFTAVA